MKLWDNICIWLAEHDGVLTYILLGWNIFFVLFYDPIRGGEYFIGLKGMIMLVISVILLVIRWMGDYLRR